MTVTLNRSIRLHRPADDVFAWLERPCAIERLTPPWEEVEVLSQSGGLHNGSRTLLRVKVGPFRTTWEAEHRDYREGRTFRDVMVRGPFPSWEHLHQVDPDGPGVSVLTDAVRYSLPLGVAGTLAAGWVVRRRLNRLFDYRHAVMRDDVMMAVRYGAVRGMRILVSGAGGLVGRALVPFLRHQGHEVLRLVRRVPAGPDEIFWDPAKGELDLSAQKPFDAVIHLAGESIAGGRWTPERREAIRSSRVQGTRTLVEALGRLRHRPFAFVSASAVGFYGDCGSRVLHEDGRRGAGFLAEVCDAWEAEARASAALGIRVALMRMGVVLTPAGGALAKMLPLFRAGLGGRIGNGRQWMSWISIDDAVGALYHAVLDHRCSGPVNVVAPEPVTNGEFAATLGHILRRPAILPVPRPVLTMTFGQMGRETLVPSTRAVPRVLDESRYPFRHESLEEALRHVLGRAQPAPRT